MKYAEGTVLYPLTFAEWNVAAIGPQILVEDIESYAYPEGERRRYTNAGWDKAIALGIAIIRASDNSSAGI